VNWCSLLSLSKHFTLRVVFNISVCSYVSRGTCSLFICRGDDLPFIKVNLVEGRTDEQRERLTKAITDAAVEILESVVSLAAIESRFEFEAAYQTLRSYRQLVRFDLLVGVSLRNK